MKKQLLLSIIVIFLGLASHADYSIEVCRIPFSQLASDIDTTKFIKIFHVFVKGTTPLETTSLHFGPANNDFAAMALGKSFTAKISHQHYPDAECVEILSTYMKSLFENKWTTIKNAHQQAVATHPYHLYNTVGKNCGSVVQSAVEEAELKFPWPNINGQDHLATVLYGLGGDLTDPTNVGNVINSGLKIAEEIIPGSTDNCLIQ